MTPPRSWPPEAPLPPRLGQASRRRAQTVEARVEPRQLVLHGRQVEQISVHDLAKLRMRLARRRSPEGDHPCDFRIEQTLAQYTLTDHATGTEDEHVHRGSLTDPPPLA